MSFSSLDTFDVTAACLAVFAAATLMLLGYVVGYRRGKAVAAFEAELAAVDAARAMPVNDTATRVLRVPTITDAPPSVPLGAYVRVPQPPPRRMSDAEWLDEVSGTVILGAVPDDTSVWPTMNTGPSTGPWPRSAPVPAPPSNAMSAETEAFIATMRRQTDTIIAQMEAEIEVPQLVR